MYNIFKIKIQGYNKLILIYICKDEAEHNQVIFMESTYKLYQLII